MLGSATALDGDTFAFGDDIIRIHGIDAPEATQTCLRHGEEWECGQAAVKQLQALLDRGRVRCQQLERDEYDRAVSVCEANGVDIGQALLASGMAVALQPAAENYREAEKQAQALLEGIWAGDFQLPADYRAENPQIEQARPPERTEPPAPMRQSQQTSRQVYYRNCDAARAAGAAPLRRGEPGYRPALDADNDGIACEPYRGRR